MILLKKGFSFAQNLISYLNVKKLLSSIFILACAIFSTAQNICDIEVNPVCSSETFNVQAPNSSYEGSIESCDGNIYPLENVVWYEMRVLEGSTFTFMIELSLGDDYDFALWKNPDCEHLGVPDRASFIHEPNFGITTTGLMMNEEDECESLGDLAYNTPGFVRHLDVQPGDILLLMIQRPLVTESGYDFNIVFDGTGGNAVLDCSIVGNVYPKCDVDDNGSEIFSDSDFLADLIVDYPSSTFEFYASHTDAMLGNIAQSISFPYTALVENSPENLFVRIEDLDGTFNRVVQISLVVHPIPTLNSGIEIELCDDNFDGVYSYNLSNLPVELTAASQSLNFSYYQSLADATNQLNPLSSEQVLTYTMSSLPHTIWVVAENNNGCFSFPVSVQFIANPSIATTGHTFGPIEFCEGEFFDLRIFEDTISSQENIFYTYFETLEDAQNNINPIANTSQYTTTGNGEIFLRLDHESLCSSLVTITYAENLIPEILNLPVQLEICENESEQLIINSTLPNSTFKWLLNGEEVLEGNDVILSEIGTYTVQVISEDGCVSEKDFVVVRPPTPTIISLEYGPDYVLVKAEEGGDGGALEYSLDEVFWQSHPQFNNLTLGETYTVHVRQDGCMKDSYKFVMLAIPNFISPNGDGINDTFSIRGMQLFPDASIKLFDRYGKIFVDTKFQGNYEWNGKYLGRAVPSGDYWYIIEIPSDGISKAQKWVGHVAVRNQ